MSLNEAPVERWAYSPAEAAKALGISRAHLYNLLAAGALPSVKVGRSRRIRAEALRAYLDSLDTGPVGP